MFELVPYKKEHVIPMLDQKENLALKEPFLAGAAEGLEATGATTIMVNGIPAVCGGVLQYWEGRGQVWAVFNEEFKNNFVPVFRGLKVFIKVHLEKYRRLETSIPLEFPKGKRRAEMLGFKLECELARQYLPNGGDASLYSIVRE